MSGIKGLTLKDGASSMAVTGGSDMTFQTDGQVVQNGVHVANIAQSDFRIRENLSCKYRAPKQNADGSYVKEKFSATYAEPFVNSKGIVEYNVLRLDLEVSPNAPAGTNLNCRLMGGQLLTNTNLSNFWLVGSQD